MTRFSLAVSSLLLFLAACAVPYDLAVARKAYRTQLVALEASAPRDVPALADALTRAAQVEEQYGHLEEAGRLLDRAAEVWNERASAEPKPAALALEHAGRNALGRRAPRDAVQRYARAASLLDGAGLRGDPLWVDVQRGLAFSYELLGEPTQAAEHLQSVGDADGPAALLMRVEPRYPTWAASNEMPGWVVLAVTIGEDGSVTDARVLDGWPGDLFHEVAIDAVRQWRYLPELVDGHPAVLQGVKVKLEFKPMKGPGDTVRQP